MTGPCGNKLEFNNRKMENPQTFENSMHCKYLKRLIKINKLHNRLIKNKREKKIQVTSIRDEEGDVTTNPN